MYYVNPNIKKLYRTSYSESRKNYLRLDMNENPEGLPTPFFEKVMNSITPEYVATYPEMASLIGRLAGYLHCEPTNICLTNGSDDAIRLLFEVFGEPGKKVVSVSPSFEMYAVYINMYGMLHSPVPYNEKFEVSLDDILATVDSDTGIVVLLNPNSPVGASWTEMEVRAVIEKARENNAVVVIDEAYYYFNPTTFLHVVNEYDNVMVFRTFSKMLSIAGCRVGFIISNDQLISEIKKACSTYPVNCFAIRFAEMLLEDTKIIDDLIEIEKHGRDYLLSQLEQYNYKYHFNYGNYVLIKSNKKPKEIFEALKQRNILIKTYHAPILSDWIRVTTGSIDTMRIFWEQFKEVDQVNDVICT
ncbi:pyridoxal phosphate-dependent aminotransferase [Paenibacillus assamensis]|uniref:pyridoxal phosphate-dependent aminotransferase n=1 Tax=Paenibacillus assamensis TaxID=311244 RepID=UPI00041F9381|nr:histidinol-phosphate transaminase [Paenibacillus assamensis]